MVWSNRRGYDGIRSVHQIKVIQHDNPTIYDYMGGMLSASDDGTVFITTITALGCAGGTGGQPRIQVWRKGGSGSYYLAQEIFGGVGNTPNNNCWAVKACLSGDGQTLVIPSPRYGTGGKVEIYKNVSGTFTYVADLPDPAVSNMASARFGYSTDISYDGKYIIVGLPTRNWEAVSDEGDVAMYVDAEGDGTYVLEFLWSDDVAGWGYGADTWGGYCVCMNKDATVVAVSYRSNTPDYGTVKVYDVDHGLSTVTINSTLTAPVTGGNTDNRFGLPNVGCPEWFPGRAMAMNDSGSLLLIGASGARATKKGGAYLFELTGGVYVIKQSFEPTLTDWNHYGYHIAISPTGNLILIGAQGYNSGQGGVDLYTYNATSDIFEHFPNKTFVQPEGVADGDVPYFGYAVEINDQILLVTATDENERGGAIVDVGATYLFSFDAVWTNRAGY